MEKCCCCSPAYQLLDKDGRPLPGDPLAEARRLVAAGAVAAVKGIGGYHLACNALDTAAVAPGNPYVGMMLPYAPVHWLLLAPGDVWVMTSGNTSDEPIAISSAAAAGSRPRL